MNAKQVLNRIATMLSLNTEVQFVDAKTADGTILQSPTFDLGESVEVVSEDGTKTPAPNGEYQISLKDTEGNEVLIRVVVADGKINERENVEEAQPESETEMADADAEKIKTEPLPGDPTEANDEDVENKGNKATTDLAGVAEANGPLGAHPENNKVGPLPTTTDKPEMDMSMVASKFEEMGYRISELEKMIAEKAAEAETEDTTTEEELPKLDGAPVEATQMFSQQDNQKRYGKKEGNYQSTFLSKLYK
jgi:hypothetical protein